MRITKREILASIAIVCIMLLIGVCIADNIKESVMERQQEYATAIKIDNDKDLFVHCMETNAGNAFVYGELKAVDPVTYEEIGGQYSYVKKTEEHYRRHTRTVTKTKKVNGKTVTYTETEVYYSWDAMGSQSRASSKITFLDVEFDYGEIDFPLSSHIKTIKESSKVRFVYSGAPAQCIGTIYSDLRNDTINNTNMYHYSTIDEAYTSAMTDYSTPFFWFSWVVLTAGAVWLFFVAENHWLEG